MKWRILIFTLIFSLLLLVGCSSKQAVLLDMNNSSDSEIIVTNLMKTRDDRDGDGIPDAGEIVFGTNPYAWDTDGDGISDKEDKTPDFTENLIQETSSNILPATVKDICVVDNHLEITLCNTGMENLTDFDLYYTITDETDGKVEGYYQKLSGFVLKKGATKTLYLDNDTTQARHYFLNINGLYGTLSDGLIFEAQIHAEGYKSTTFSGLLQHSSFLL